MTPFEWVATVGAAIGAGTAIVVVCRFIFRLDAKVDLLGEKMDQLAERMERAEASISRIADSIVSLVERTARLEGRVDELSRKDDRE